MLIMDEFGYFFKNRFKENDIFLNMNKEEIEDYLYYNKDNCIDYIRKTQRKDFNSQYYVGGKAFESMKIRLFETEDIKQIEKFLDLGMDINIEDGQGKNALQNCINENKEKARFLIEKGINLHNCDNQGNNVLCYCHDEEMLEILLLNNVDYKVENDKGRNALFSHIPELENFERIVKKVKPSEKIDWNHKDKKGNTLLHSFDNNKKSIRFLLKKKININAQNNDGETMLWFLFGEKMYKKDFLFFLKKQGLDVNIKNVKNKNYLDVRLCEKEVDKNRLSIFGIKSYLKVNNIDLVKNLVEAGINTHFLDEKYINKMHCSEEVQSYLQNICIHNALQNLPTTDKKIIRL